MAHTGRLSEERLAEIKEAALLATMRCEACDDDEGEYADCTCSEVGESGIAFIAVAGSVVEVAVEVVSLREALAARETETDMLAQAYVTSLVGFGHTPVVAQAAVDEIIGHLRLAALAGAVVGGAAE